MSTADRVEAAAWSQVQKGASRPAQPAARQSGPGNGPTSSAGRALIIEDNPKMAAAIAQGLREQGYTVEVSLTGAQGEELASRGTFDVVVLDLMLPDRDGLDICRSLRKRNIKAPILILSAISGTTDKVSGLNAGADDYLAKPFEFEELLARVRALLRRGQAGEGVTLRFGDLSLDLTRRVARRGEATVQLTSKEFSLLEYFMRNPGRVLTRTEIGEHVWAANFDPASNVIDVYVSMLRRKVDRGFPVQLINTIIGTGYLFGNARE